MKKYSCGKILITGCYRSGTEFITNVLNDHPDISAFSYVTNFMRYYYGGYLKNNTIDYIKLLDQAEIYTNLRFGKSLDTNSIKKKLSNKSKITYAKIYNLMMKDLVLNVTKKKIWAEKTQLVWRKIPDFLKMYPDGKSIIVIRDPRNVLASFKKMTNAPKPLYLGAIFNMYDVFQKAAFYKRKYKDRVLVIKFEEFIANINLEKKKIIGFLDENLEKKFDINQNYWKSFSGKTWSINSSFKNKIRSNMYANKIKWMKYLTKSEISLCEHVNEYFMNYFNYEVILKKKVGYDRLIKNLIINKYYHSWKYKNSGIEEFPSDPLNPKNWNII